MKSNNNKIADVLKELIIRNKWQNGLDRTDIPAAWYRVMGPGVKNYTISVEFNNGTLYVSLSSSVLRQELSYGKEKIIAMINEEIRREAVKQIVLK